MKSQTQWVFWVVAVFAIFLRIDGLNGSKKIRPGISVPQFEGAAISLTKGFGFRSYPIPNYGSKKGEMVDPKDYMTWDEFKKIENPDKLPIYTFNPGVPLLMATFYKLFGFRHLWYQIYQLLWSLAHVWLAYQISMLLFKSQKAALLSGILFAFFLPEIRFSLLIGREIQTTSAALLAAYFALKIGNVTKQEQNPWQLAGLAGLLIGFCSLFRGTALPFLILFSLTLFFLVPWRRALQLGFTAWLTGLLVLSPWMIRNKKALGTYALSHESKFFALWGGVGMAKNSLAMNGTDTVAFNTVYQSLRLQSMTVPDYYNGGSPIYEAEAKKLYLSALKLQPYTQLKAFMEKALENWFRHDVWAYGSFKNYALPKFKALRPIENQLHSLWIALAKAVPWFALVGFLYLGYVAPYRLMAFVLPIGLSWVQISLVASHIQRYTTHLFAMQMILASIGLFALFRLRQRSQGQQRL